MGNVADEESGNFFVVCGDANVTGSGNQTRGGVVLYDKHKKGRELRKGYLLILISPLALETYPSTPVRGSGLSMVIAQLAEFDKHLSPGPRADTAHSKPKPERGSAITLCGGYRGDINLSGVQEGEGMASRNRCTI